jgi:hypothetical protein
MEPDPTQDSQKLLESNAKLNATADASTTIHLSGEIKSDSIIHSTEPAPKKTEALTDAQKRAEEERQKKESLKVMMAYSKREKGLFCIGMFCLFVG